MTHWTFWISYMASYSLFSVLFFLKIIFLKTAGSYLFWFYFLPLSLIPFVFFNNLLVSISICHWNLNNITTHNFALSCIFYRSMQETSQIWHNLPVCNIFWLRYSIWQWYLKNSWHKNKTTDMQIENTIEKLQAKTRAHGTLSVAVSRSPVYS